MLNELTSIQFTHFYFSFGVPVGPGAERKSRAAPVRTSEQGERQGWGQAATALPSLYSSPNAHILLSGSL